MNLKKAFISVGFLLAFLPTIQGETLSNNLEATTDYTEPAAGDSWVAASFRTGATAYNLTDVTLLMFAKSGGTAQVGLYSDGGGAPGALLSTLTSPSSYSATLANTLFKDSNQLLAADSTYWVTLQGIGGSFQWAFTDDNTGSGVGFRPNWAFTEDAGRNWTTSAIQPMQMRVDASAVPEPSSISLLGLSLIICLMPGALKIKTRSLRGRKIDAPKLMTVKKRGAAAPPFFALAAPQALAIHE